MKTKKNVTSKIRTEAEKLSDTRLDVTRMIHPESGKEVHLVGVCHVGSPAYFDLVDDLMSFTGSTVLCEGIRARGQNITSTDFGLDPSNITTGNLNRIGVYRVMAALMTMATGEQYADQRLWPMFVDGVHADLFVDELPAKMRKASGAILSSGAVMDFTLGMHRIMVDSEGHTPVDDVVEAASRASADAATFWTGVKGVLGVARTAVITATGGMKAVKNTDVRDRRMVDTLLDSGDTSFVAPWGEAHHRNQVSLLKDAGFEVSGWDMNTSADWVSRGSLLV